MSTSIAQIKKGNRVIFFLYVDQDQCPARSSSQGRPERFTPTSLVVGPQTENLDRMVLLKDLIDQPMLDVNSSRVCAPEVTDQPLKWWWRYPWIVCDEIQQLLGLGFESGGGELLDVPLGLAGKVQCPRHQSSSVDVS